jgi:hypothetical protein
MKYYRAYSPVIRRRFSWLRWNARNGQGRDRPLSADSEIKDAKGRGLRVPGGQEGRVPEKWSVLIGLFGGRGIYGWDVRFGWKLKPGKRRLMTICLPVND